MRRHWIAAVAVCLATWLSGCGDDGGDACTVGTAEGCDEGEVCEMVVGSEEPACFTPVEIHGRVFDATTDMAIEGARLVALDANGGARSGVTFSGPMGEYELPVSIARDPEGQPQMEAVTLRVSAAGYQTFPTAPRTALPIDLTAAMETGEEGELVVQHAATDVALIPMEGDTSALVSIEGRVDHEDAGGVLVVAEQGGTAVSTSVTGSNGAFVLYNVPAAETEVKGFRAGLAVAPMALTPPATDVVLSASTEGLSTVTGRVEIVAADGGSQTSVILVVESTFDEAFVRGEAPAGLRANMVSGDFEIPDVPPGRYVVLAAFENDGLVRDPDENIAGTDIVHISVPEEAAIDQSFKVTDALDVISPGAMGLEVIASAEPTFVWENAPSEDGYEVRVFDAYGEMVHEDTMVPEGQGGADITYTWTGASLERGMVYQFRAVSFTVTPRMRYLNATEDLKGVFMFDPSP